MIQIDGYEILNPIGVGGMGEVYLANQLGTSRKVALKVLLPQYAGNPESSQQFLREGQITAGLSHPHIVSIYDVAEFADIPYLAMEYLPAGDLKSMLRSQANQFMVLNAIHQIAGALAYTHGLGVIHGDVKPQNILFQDAGHAVLTDFGIAREKEEIFGAENAFYAMGSPLYISPEQVLGEQPSHLSDIYSLGVILFEALMGHPPFLAESSLATARLRLSALDAPKLTEEYSDYQTFIDLMMARHPKNRLELSEFIGDFHAVMQGITGQEMEKTQRLSVEDYHQTKDSDFFFIAPTNLSEAQDRTQRIQPENNDSAELRTSLEIPEVVQLNDTSVNVVTDDEISAMSEYSQKKDEPLKEWVTTENTDIVLEAGGGKLNDFFFFLHEIKENLKETIKIRVWNYPHAEDLELFFRPVKNEVKRQSSIITEKLSRQTKLLFTTGIVLVSIGVVGAVFSNEKAPQAMLKALANPVPSQPEQTATQTTDSGAGRTEVLRSLFQAENLNDGVDDTAKPVQILAGEPGKEVANEEFDPALLDNRLQQKEPSPQSANKQQFKSAVTKTAVSDAHSPGATELAMLETVILQPEVSEIKLRDTHVSEGPVKSGLDSGVVVSGGRRVIDRELEAALGGHVGWMIRRKDGSLSLFVDWVDLVNGAGDDFSDEAKNSLNVLGYIVRNYDGFTISILDHSHQQKTVSAARARKVLNYLREQGVPSGRMQTLAMLTGNTGNVEMRLIPKN